MAAIGWVLQMQIKLTARRSRRISACCNSAGKHPRRSSSPRQRPRNLPRLQGEEGGLRIAVVGEHAVVVVVGVVDGAALVGAVDVEVHVLDVAGPGQHGVYLTVLQAQG